MKKQRGWSKGNREDIEATRGRAYAMMLRMRVVTQVLEGKGPLGRLSRIFGPSPTTILKLADAYKRGGIDALEPKPTEQPVRRRSSSEGTKHGGAAMARQDDPPDGGDATT